MLIQLVFCFRQIKDYTFHFLQLLFPLPPFPHNSLISSVLFIATSVVYRHTGFVNLALKNLGFCKFFLYLWCVCCLNWYMGMLSFCSMFSVWSFRFLGFGKDSIGYPELKHLICKFCYAGFVLFCFFVLIPIGVFLFTIYTWERLIFFG